MLLSPHLSIIITKVTGLNIEHCGAEFNVVVGQFENVAIIVAGRNNDLSSLNQFYIVIMLIFRAAF